MSNLQYFQSWAKSSDTPFTINLKQAVVYTRVSTKEQSDKNLSLDFQKKAILEYASRNGITIQSFFGGTYESAKTDGRKEFQRMLDFVGANKGKVSHILVYTTDRFSRTGGAAIKLAQDLREKYGVMVFAVTQPTDTTNPNGVFQQNIQFLFGEFDNQLRRQRVIAGMKEKFEKGIWCIRPPMGYDVVTINSERKIVVNKDGQLLKKAFQWKKNGHKSDEILKRLNASGMHIYKQKLAGIFSNPFYCGIISNKLLEGRVIDGVHPAIVSQDDFLIVNEIRMTNTRYGVPHKNEVDALPLKVFVKCEKCNQGYTGYIVKKKNLYYYKCRTTGCGCNKNAKELNSLFEEYLKQFQINPAFIPQFYKIMCEMIGTLNEENVGRIKQHHLQLADVQKKIDTLEEKYFITGGMSDETYNKFLAKYSKEKGEIHDSISTCGKSSSNLSEYYGYALKISSNIASVWTSSPIAVKEKIQNLIFPEGILYNHEKHLFRTHKTNEVFMHIAGLARDTAENETGQSNKIIELSSSVVPAGFEPEQTVPKTVVLPLHHRTIV